ncbi:MAG TPA: hypothetical protein VFV31_12740 [Chitinophagaceae bacterium]|nr:hypothetical protein [Chitinophagaceae bacterium]
MDRRFNRDREFEQFVKQNADQYRMFPSEKVWEGIHNTLHTRRRWYGIGLALLLLSTATVTSVMLNNAGKKQELADKAPVTVYSPAAGKETTKQPVMIAPEKPVVRNTFNARPDKVHALLVNDKMNGSPETKETVSSTDEEALALESFPSIHFIKPSVTDAPVAETKNTDLLRKQIATKKVTAPVPVVMAGKNVQAIQPLNTEAITDKPDVNTNEIAVQKKEAVAERRYTSPYTIESVLNAYKFKRGRKKIAWQVYITPTISYRKLEENKAFLNAARNLLGTPANYSYSFSDINSIVTHKPDIGLQMGFSGVYPLTKRLRITAGLQFNISKYDIRAYNHDGEVATIALSNNAGGTNTVSTITNYRNIGGYKADWLANMYVSGSAPVGLELILSKTNKTTVGVAGTLQPTYILGNRAYLLSADFKNYAEVPSLTRKWNLNTGFEVFAGYRTGNVDWRIGPNVRYQVFSSFVNKYPIKEHLFDFGLKLGIMLR